jgi:peptide methionine sulfoxide reductase MsrA
MYHDEEQKGLAEKTLQKEDINRSGHIVTKVLPAKEFYDAEE